MTEVPLNFRSGFAANTTKYASKDRWVDGSRVRFQDGLPEKIGGWRAITPTGATLTGVCRGTFGWVSDTDARRYMAIGTHSNLYIYDGDEFEDITPAGFTSGEIDSRKSTGYGVGPYGEEAYGVSRTVTSGADIYATTWSFDLWGDELLACSSTDGLIYRWTGAGSGIATLLHANAPIDNVAMFVTDERHVVGIGAGDDWRKIEWSDREDFTVWTAASTNSAGDKNIVSPGRLLGAKKARGGTLIFTNKDVYLMAFQGQPFVYAHPRVGTDCGVAGANAMVANRDVLYWMGNDAFYMYDGAVRELPSDVRDHVFDDINLEQIAKTYAAVNRRFHEVWWFYASAASSEVDRYVVYNWRENIWYFGLMERTAYLDNDFFDFPFALDASSVLYEHEMGTDDDGAAMGEFIESAPMELSNGERVMRLYDFIPDFDLTGQVDVTLKGKFHPSDTTTTDSGPHTIIPTTDRQFVRLAARQVAVRIDNSAAGSNWTLGRMRVDVRQGGGKR